MNLFLSVLTCIAVVFFMPLKKVTGSWKAYIIQKICSLFLELTWLHPEN